MDAASGPLNVHEDRRHCDRRATKLPAGRRLARRSSRPEHTRIGAARLRAWRVAGVAVCAGRSARERNAVQRSARAPAQFAKRASGSEGGRVSDGPERARDPRPRDGPPRDNRRRCRPGRHAAQRRAVARKGWKPDRVETRTAGPGLDAQHDSPAPRSGVRPGRGGATHGRQRNVVGPPHYLRRRGRRGVEHPLCSGRGWWPMPAFCQSSFVKCMAGQPLFAYAGNRPVADPRSESAFDSTAAASRRPHSTSGLVPTCTDGQGALGPVPVCPQRAMCKSRDFRPPSRPDCMYADPVATNIMGGCAI